MSDSPEAVIGPAAARLKPLSNSEVPSSATIRATATRVGLVMRSTSHPNAGSPLSAAGAAKGQKSAIDARPVLLGGRVGGIVASLRTAGNHASRRWTWLAAILSHRARS